MKWSLLGRRFLHTWHGEIFPFSRSMDYCNVWLLLLFHCVVLLHCRLRFLTTAWSYHLIQLKLKRIQNWSCLLLLSAKMFNPVKAFSTNSVDPDPVRAVSSGATLFASISDLGPHCLLLYLIWVHTVCFHI